jgi:hypothetical protein
MLGVGAFGEVYVAENELTGEMHAVKSLYSRYPKVQSDEM